MIRAHKIRLNPTPEQAAYFRKAAGTSRFVYNWGLAAWKAHKAAHPGEPHGPMALKKDYNALKGEQFPWIYEVAKDVAEGAFTNLAAAMKNYYDSQAGKRAGKQVGFPHFKTKKKGRTSFRLNNDKMHVDDHALYVPKLGWVNMAEALRLTGKIMGAVVSCQGSHWYVSISVELETPPPVDFEELVVGIDLNLKALLVLSDGTQRENQTLLRSELTHLKRLARRLSRCTFGSQRWYRTKERLANFQERIANRRADYLHKTTTPIARTFAVVGLEDLNVAGTQHLRVWAGVLKNHHLALSLSDAAFGEIRRQLEYKCAGFGGHVVTVDRFYPSSRLCGACGLKNDGLTLADREWVCPACGALHQRDANAARNIEQEVLRRIGKTPVVATSGVKARGGDVRPAGCLAVPVETRIFERSLLNT
jgi:putative transposase